jgi:hypothetical protein
MKWIVPITVYLGVHGLSIVIASLCAGNAWVRVLALPVWGISCLVYWLVIAEKKGGE